MKIGYFSYSAIGADAVSLLPKLAEFGYKTVELATWEEEPFSPELLGTGGSRKLKRELDTSGLSVSALACHTTFVYSEVAKKQERIDWFRRRAELAAELETDILTTATGPVPENLSAVTSWDQLVEVTGAILDAIENFGMRLAIEVHAHPGEWTGHLVDILRLLDAHPGKSRLGVNLDCSHFIVNGDGWKQAATVLIPRTIHVHLKGMKGKEFTNCGDSDDDFPAQGLIAMLQSAGYTGAISVENIPAKNWSKKAMVSARYLKGIISENR